MGFVASLFGGGAPAPAPVPLSPVDDGSAKRARDEAAAAAIAEGKANGRRSTIAGGARGALESRQADQARKILG